MIFSAVLSNTPTYRSHIYQFVLSVELFLFFMLVESYKVRSLCHFSYFSISCVFLPEQMVNEVVKNKRSIEGKHSHLCVCDSLSLAAKSHFDLCVFLCVSLAEFCLSCGKTSATFHPLFEGGLCPTCKVERQTHVT